MDKLYGFLSTLDSQFKAMRVIAVVSVVCLMLGCGAAAYFALSYVREHTKDIYLIDQGSVLAARAVPRESQLPVEVRDQVIRFHEYILNLSPNRESINYYRKKADYICDESGRSYYKTLEERGFYDELIRAQAVQVFAMDSIMVDCTRQPYRAQVFGKLKVSRSSRTLYYDFQSSCELVQTSIDPNNPHGLLIRKFVGQQGLIER